MGDHLTLSAQYAADIGPLAMLDEWRDLNAWRCPAVWLVFTPCCPNRIVLTLSPLRATTMWDLVGWLGVRLGLLYPVTPALVSRGSFGVGISYLLLYVQQSLLLACWAQTAYQPLCLHVSFWL